MTNLDVLDKIIDIMKKTGLTSRQVIKGAMKYWQFNDLDQETIINLLEKKYDK